MLPWRFVDLWLRQCLPEVLRSDESSQTLPTPIQTKLGAGTIDQRLAPKIAESVEIARRLMKRPDMFEMK